MRKAALKKQGGPEKGERPASVSSDPSPEVIREFFDELTRLARETFGSGTSPTERLLLFVRRCTDFFGRRSDLLLAVWGSPSRESAETLETKARAAGEAVREVCPLLFADSKALLSGDRRLAAVLIPAVLGLLASHHLLKPLLVAMDAAPLDDRFYRLYAAAVADLAVTGALTVALNAKIGKYETDPAAPAPDPDGRNGRTP